MMESEAPGSRRRGAASRFGAVATSLILALAAAGAATHSSRAAAAAGAAVGSGEAGTSEPAHWVQKKFKFTYQGFTTHYSCQGLRDKVREVLLELGARRSDLNVHAIGCTRSIGRPEPSPSVGGTFYVLEPGSSPAGQSTEAAWRPVDVRVGTGGLDSAGQCELVEQVKQEILPLFSTRNVSFKQHCVPHQLAPSGSLLSLEVLKPAPRADSSPHD